MSEGGNRPAPGGETFETLRLWMFSIAYRMLGSVAEAEDTIQEAFLRYRRALDAAEPIESPRAYLSAVVTRLAIDQLRSARARRETYVGQWLPEPLFTSSDADDPAARTEKLDSLSMAFLLLLERLNPVERAVFLLHDVFDYEFSEIAKVVGKSPSNCRQLATRARRQVQAGRPRFHPGVEERTELARRFFDAISAGDMSALLQTLGDDVVVYGDGGGKAPQWSTPISGAERVAQLFSSLGGRMREIGVRLEPREINGQPGAVFRDAGGRITNVFSLDVIDGKVRTVRSVINPDKLQHLGEVADVRALLQKRGTPS